MPEPTSLHHQSESDSRGRDELNLIDFPIGTLQYQQPTDSQGKRPDELVCVVDSFDPDLDEIVPRKLVRRTSSRHGFPTPVEDEVLVGLLTLTRIKNNFKAPRIEFRNGELFKLMGWPHNGTSGTRLSVALDRLTGLTLKYENSWTTDDGAFVKEFTTGLLESYKITRQTRGRRSRNGEKSWIQWTSEVFADIQRGNVKALNTDEFFSLEKPVSQRMYRFLDKHLTQYPHFEMDLATFASHIGLSETRHVGKIKERLAPGLAELESLPGFIRRAEPDQRYRKRGPGDWLILFHRPTEPQPIPSSSLKRPLAATDEAANLVKEFYRLWSGDEQHSPTSKELQQAGALVDRYGVDRTHELLVQVVKLMRQQFPEARAFGATNLYWSDAEARHRKQEVHRKREVKAATHEEHQEQRRAQEAHRREQLKAHWQLLSSAQQQEIREYVARTAAATVRQFIKKGKYDDPLVQLACLDELSRRRAD